MGCGPSSNTDAEHYNSLKSLIQEQRPTGYRINGKDPQTQFKLDPESIFIYKDDFNPSNWTQDYNVKHQARPIHPQQESFSNKAIHVPIDEGVKNMQACKAALEDQSYCIVDIDTIFPKEDVSISSLFGDYHESDEQAMDIHNRIRVKLNDTLFTGKSKLEEMSQNSGSWLIENLIKSIEIIDFITASNATTFHYDNPKASPHLRVWFPLAEHKRLLVGSSETGEIKASGKGKIVIFKSMKTTPDDQNVCWHAGYYPNMWQDQRSTDIHLPGHSHMKSAVVNFFIDEDYDDF